MGKRMSTKYASSHVLPSEWNTKRLEVADCDHEMAGFGVTG